METNGKNKSYPTLNGHGDDSAGFVNVARTSPGAGGRFARKNTDIDFRKLLALLSTDRKGASELRILAEHIKVLLEKENYILGPNAVHAALVVMWEIEIGDCDVVLFRPDGSSLSMQNQTDASECFMVKDEEGLGIAMVVFDQGTYMQGLYRVVVRQRSDGQSSQNPKARAVLYDYAEPNRYNKPSLVWLIDAEGEGDTWLVGSFEFNQLNKLRYVTKYNRITRSIPRRWPDEQRNEVEHHIVSRAPSGESRLSGSFFANDDLYDTNNRLSLGDSKPAPTTPTPEAAGWTAVSPMATTPAAEHSHHHSAGEAVPAKTASAAKLLDIPPSAPTTSTPKSTSAPAPAAHDRDHPYSDTESEHSGAESGSDNDIDRRSPEEIERAPKVDDERALEILKGLSDVQKGAARDMASLQLEELAETRREIAEYEKRLKAVNQDVAARDREIAKLQADMEMSSIGRIVRNIHKNEREKARLRADLQNLHDHMDDVQRDIARMKARNTEQYYHQREAELEELNAKIAQERARIEQMTGEKSLSVADLRKIYDTERSTHNKLQLQLKELESDIEQLNLRLRHAGNMRMMLSERQRELDSVKGKLHSVEDQYRAEAGAGADFPQRMQALGKEKHKFDLEFSRLSSANELLLKKITLLEEDFDSDNEDGDRERERFEEEFSHVKSTILEKLYTLRDVFTGVPKNFIQPPTKYVSPYSVGRPDLAITQQEKELSSRRPTRDAQWIVGRTKLFGKSEYGSVVSGLISYHHVPSTNENKVQAEDRSRRFNQDEFEFDTHPLFEPPHGPLCMFTEPYLSELTVYFSPEQHQIHGFRFVYHSSGPAFTMMADRWADPRVDKYKRITFDPSETVTQLILGKLNSRIEWIEVTTNKRRVETFGQPFDKDSRHGERLMISIPARARFLGLFGEIGHDGLKTLGATFLEPFDPTRHKVFENKLQNILHWINGVYPGHYAYGRYTPEKYAGQLPAPAPDLWAPPRTTAATAPTTAVPVRTTSVPTAPTVAAAKPAGPPAYESHPGYRDASSYGKYGVLPPDYDSARFLEQHSKKLAPPPTEGNLFAKANKSPVHSMMPQREKEKLEKVTSAAKPQQLVEPPRVDSRRRSSSRDRHDRSYRHRSHSRERYYPRDNYDNRDHYHSHSRAQSRDHYVYHDSHYDSHRDYRDYHNEPPRRHSERRHRSRSADRSGYYDRY